jgi:hypothetical protein
LIVALIALAALLAAAFALVAVTVLRLAPGPVRTGRRVTVHTRQPDDQTLHGVLVRDYRDRLELEGAEIVTAQGNTTIPGTVHVPAEAVSWLQDHGARS